MAASYKGRASVLFRGAGNSLGYRLAVVEMWLMIRTQQELIAISSLHYRYEVCETSPSRDQSISCPSTR